MPVAQPDGAQRGDDPLPTRPLPRGRPARPRAQALQEGTRQEGQRQEEENGTHPRPPALHQHEAEHPVSQRQVHALNDGAGIEWVRHRVNVPRSARGVTSSSASSATSVITLKKIAQNTVNKRNLLQTRNIRVVFL